MKKRLLSILVLLTLGLSVPVNALEQNQGEISVNITEYKEISPDTAEISFAIKTYDTKSIQAASNLNKEISKKVFDKLNKSINPLRGDYVKTSSFNAVPLYSYVNSKKVFDKYEVSNNIIVKTKSIDRLGSMIDDAILLGATNVDSLSFSQSNYDSICDELISKASEKAKKRADIVAKSLSTSVYGFKNISTSCSANENNSPRFYYAKNIVFESSVDSTQAGSGTSISSGAIKINANVHANFLAK